MMKDMKEQMILTPSAFEAACKKADWYFQYSDDHKVYQAGKVECVSLFQQAKEDATLMEIFQRECPFPSAPCYR